MKCAPQYFKVFLSCFTCRGGCCVPSVAIMMRVPAPEEEEEEELPLLEAPFVSAAVPLVPPAEEEEEEEDLEPSPPVATEAAPPLSWWQCMKRMEEMSTLTACKRIFF